MIKEEEDILTTEATRKLNQVLQDKNDIVTTYAEYIPEGTYSLENVAMGYIPCYLGSGFVNIEKIKVFTKETEKQLLFIDEQGQEHSPQDNIPYEDTLVVFAEYSNWERID